VIVGSSTPFTIDEAELDRRIAEPAIAGDLERVTMGSATAFLSYFVMGTEGMTRFAQKGILNTDDRPYLEFSAPFSIADPEVMAANVDALAAHRENLLPRLTPAEDPAARDAQIGRWDLQFRAGQMGDQALALFLGRSPADPVFTQALRRLNLEYPEYAPGRALWTEHQTVLATEPRLLDLATLQLVNQDGREVVVEISAVLVPVSRTRASIMFVDNRAHAVYGQVYMDDYDRDGRAKRFAADVTAEIRSVYAREALAARGRKPALPSAPEMLQNIKAIIDSKVKSVQSGT